MADAAPLVIGSADLRRLALELPATPEATLAWLESHGVEGAGIVEMAAVLRLHLPELVLDLGDAGEALEALLVFAFELGFEACLQMGPGRRRGGSS